MSKRALEEAKETLRQTVEENCRLTQERDATQQETYAVTESLRRDLQEKTTTIQHLQTLSDKAISPPTVVGLSVDAVSDSSRVRRGDRQGAGGSGGRDQTLQERSL